MTTDRSSISVDIPHREIPDHVPPELVHPYAFGFGKKTEEDAYLTLIPPIHAGPPIFYALDAYLGGQPAWVIRRAADLRKVYLDTEHFSNRGFAPFAGLVGENWGLLPAESDPPLHGLHRAFVNPKFMPKSIRKSEEQARVIAREFIDKFKNDGECEFMSAFAYEFPIKIFLGLMGLPLDKTKLFLSWIDGLMHSGHADEMISATRAVTAYLKEEMDDRRTNPRDDLLTYGVVGKIGDRPLTDDELTGFAFNLFVGGLDAVSGHMGSLFRHLAEDQANQRLLRERPEKIPDAVSEMMRAFAGSNTYRICTKETQLCGQIIKPGDKVQMMVSLAGRDPEEYEDPNSINFDRKPILLSFATGPHFCLGVHLARMEMRIAIEEFLREIPSFRIKPGAKVTTILSGVVQPEALPLVWDVT
ncbi:cytochrome P450 [Sphingobium sp. TomTYG45]